MTPNQQQQKDRARQEAEHHNDNSNVYGTKEGYKKDIFYHQARDEYMSHTPDERATMAVPKEMLEEEYDKSPSGGYVHNANKHAPRHKGYNK